MSEIIKSFSLNTSGRDYFVGDIHGMFGMLIEQLDRVKFDSAKDRLFSVGDLVDRGDRSHEVLDWLNKPWFNSVRGNHEDMAIRYPKGNMDTYSYMANGGTWLTLLSNQEQAEIAQGLNQLPYMIEVETSSGLVGLIHAECPDNDWQWAQHLLAEESKKLRKEAQSKALWARDRITENDYSKVKGVDYLVVGHTPLHTPRRLGNVFYIDTGAVFGSVENLKTGRADMGKLTLKTIEELIEEV